MNCRVTSVVWLALGVIVAAMAATTSPVFCQGCAKNFEPPEVTSPWIHNRLGAAVLHVSANQDTGTAYLIDALRGYALTARHVVYDSQGTPHTKISVTSPGRPDEQFGVTVLASLRAEDVALIQLTEPDALKELLAFDISPRLPAVNGSTRFFTMGYPGRDNTALSTQTVEAMRPTASGSAIEVKQIAFPGDSGSPLVDVNGNVVGTCLKRLETPETLVGDTMTVATYRPMSDIISLLRKIPPSERMMEFDKRLRAGSISPKLLDVKLQPSSGGFTNLELLTWAFWLESQQPSDYVKAAPMIVCPILVACSHRKLDDVVLGALFRYANPVSKTEALLRVAERQTSLGRFIDTLKSLEAAREQLPTIPDAQARRKFSETLDRQSVRARLGLGQLPDVTRECSQQAGRAPSRPSSTEEASQLALFWNACATGAAATNDMMGAKQYLMVSGSIQPREFVMTAGSVRQDVITKEYRSGPVWSGEGETFSPAHELCSGPAPSGYQVRSVDFHLVGDRSCGAWSICKETQRTNANVCYSFSLQGHNEWTGLRKATSEGVLTVSFSKALDVR